MHLNNGTITPLRLLLLEDHAADADLLIAELRRGGVPAEVKVVGTKATYLENLDPAFDAIISDFELPQFNANEALALLQAQELDIPFIVVSGAIGEETAVDLIKRGAADYLLKDRLARLPQVLAHAVKDRLLRQERLAVQKELLENEERMRAILESALDAVVTMDGQGRIVEFNPAGEKIFGLPRDEAVGRSLVDLIIPERLREDHNRGLELYLKTGEARMLGRRLEVTAQRADGSEFPAEMAVMRIGSHEPPMFTAFVRDIGEKLRAQKAVRESEERLQSIIANLTEGLIISDMQGELLDWNPSALAMHGLTSADQCRFRLADCAAIFELSTLDGTILPVEEWPLPRIFRGEPVRDFEARVRRVGTGWERVLSFGGATVQDATWGQLAFVTVNDITEQKSAEEKLRRQEKQYRVLFATYPSPTWVYDAETLAFLAVNDAAVQHYGYSREQFLGMTLRDIRPREDIPALLESGPVTSDKPQAAGVWRHRKKNGEIILAEIFASAIQFEEHAAQLAIAIDVTEQRRAEEAIRESESRLRAIIDNEPECVKTVSANGLVLEMNAAGLRMIEAESAAQIRGLPVSDLVHPDDRARFAELHDKAVGGETGQLQFRVIGLKGRERWMETHSVGLRNGGGTPCSVLSVTRDVTDQRHAEAATRAADQHLADIINSVEGIVWEADQATGRITFISEKAEEILGYPTAQWLSEPGFWRNHLHPDDREKTIASFIAVDARLHPTELEYRMISAGGREVWIKDCVTVISPPGRSIQQRGIMLDVTERKSREATVRAGEAQIREQARLLDLAQDAIMVRDMEDRIGFWNLGAEKLYGWTGAEVRGKAGSTLLCKGDLANAAATRAAVLENGKWTGECKHLCKDGSYVTVRSRWTLVRDDAGEPKSTLIINTDITEQKRIEEQFLRAQRLESIGTLASGVAHDLNNILAPILMGAAVLRRTEMRKGDEMILSTIETCAQRGADIVKQVLTFARGDEGARLLLQPAHLINDLAKIAEGTFPKSITVRTNYLHPLWLIEGDPTQLHQVLLNLSVNARDAMPAGGALTISALNFPVDEHYASMTPGAKPGPHVLFEIKDTGMGIAREIIDQIFDPFFTTKEPGRGTGLGLSTVIGIVKSHGGFVTVESEIGRGTNFKVYFPARTEAPATLTESQASTLPLANGEMLLIVDDEKAILQVARKLLEGHGYQVVTAGDAPEALAIFALRKDEIKLVLTDLAMPLMDGIALIRTLQKMKPDVCVVASTGQGSTEQALHELPSLSVSACLTKPYNKETLLTTLHDALGPQTNKP
ncbi:MAG TPA: PAS domain S-box protein [Chthoniobacterales bacterium]|nr:PAS domain S-box protein [Chthoniobacterales bacterium]